MYSHFLHLNTLNDDRENNVSQNNTVTDGLNSERTEFSICGPSSNHQSGKHHVVNFSFQELRHNCFCRLNSNKH